MTASQDPVEDLAVLRIAGPLDASVRAVVEREVRALISSGRHAILLDLRDATDIDAGGVGALVHAYNLASAADVILRIANAAAYVRDLLARVGLFELLVAEPGRWEDPALDDRAVRAK